MCWAKRPSIDAFHIKASERQQQPAWAKLIKLPTDEKPKKTKNFLAFDQKFLRHFSWFSRRWFFYWVCGIKIGSMNQPQRKANREKVTNIFICFCNDETESLLLSLSRCSIDFSLGFIFVWNMIMGIVRGSGSTWAEFFYFWHWMIEWVLENSHEI